MSSYSPQYLHGIAFPKSVAALKKQVAAVVQQVQVSKQQAAQQQVSQQQSSQQQASQPQISTSSGPLPGLGAPGYTQDGGSVAQPQIPWLYVGIGAAVLFFIMKKKSGSTTEPIKV